VQFQTLLEIWAIFVSLATSSDVLTFVFCKFDLNLIVCISSAELIKMNDNELGGEIPNGLEDLVNLGECHAILISALTSWFIFSPIFLVLQQNWISAILV
jgi:hypothetical protein